jgi:hypothetical protein
MIMKSWAIVTILGVMVLGGPVQAQSPNLVNYQGVLKDSGGNPLTGTYSITFSLYSVSTGGTALWTETQGSVSVSNGLFSVLLGSVTPLTPSEFSGTDRWLGVTVGGDPEMTPRQRIASVPYALKSPGGIEFTYTDVFADSRLSPANAWATYGGPSDSWGGPGDRQLAFTKNTGTSLLRITYSDTLGYYGNRYDGCIWRIQIDGSTVAQFYAASFDEASGGNYWHMDNAVHSAIVPGIASGAHTITIDVYMNTASGTTQCLAGWATTGEYIMVEEIAQ